MKFLFQVLSFIFLFFSFHGQAYSFFYKNNGGFDNEPIGKNMKIYNFYMGAGAGFDLFSVQSIGAFFPKGSSITNDFLYEKYSPYFVFYFGVYDTRRAIRHELEFNYSVAATSTVNVGNSVDSTTAMSYSYSGNTALLNQYSVISQRFALFYNFIKQFDNVVSFSTKYKLGLFAGLGVGIIMQKQFVYSISQWTNNVLTVTDDINYISPDITSSNIVGRTEFYLSAGFQAMIGMTFDISSIVVGQARLKYLCTTRPFFNASLGNFYAASGAVINSHTIGLDLSIYVRIF